MNKIKDMDENVRIRLKHIKNKNENSNYEIILTEYKIKKE